MNAHIRGSAKSKIAWLSLLVIVLGFLQSNAQTLAPFIPQKYFGLVDMAVGLLLLVARFFTAGSLADKVAPEDPSTTPGE